MQHQGSALIIMKIRKSKTGQTVEKIHIILSNITRLTAFFIRVFSTNLIFESSFCCWRNKTTNQTSLRRTPQTSWQAHQHIHGIRTFPYRSSLCWWHCYFFIYIFFFSWFYYANQSPMYHFQISSHKRKSVTFHYFCAISYYKHFLL